MSHAATPGSGRVQRRLAAVLAADVVGFSRLMGINETRTLRDLIEIRRTIFVPIVTDNRGRVVKLMGDGALVEFASVVDAVNAAVEIQRALTARNEGAPRERRIELRVGVNLGDVIIEGSDIYGDGVNVAARLQEVAGPGEVALSATAHEHAASRVDVQFTDAGEHSLKNIAAPVRVFRWSAAGGGARTMGATGDEAREVPERPSIAVLPFDNMSGDPEQEYLADGVVESITAALSRIRSFFVIARNSAFAYKGRHKNVREIGRELGVGYILEGSVERVRRKRPQDLGAYGYTMQAMPRVWALEKQEAERALALLDKALEIDPDYPLALALAAWCWAQRSVYSWVKNVSDAKARALSLSERAATLSNDEPLILAILGAVHTFARNFGTARVLLERAVALDPNAAWALSRLGWLEVYSGRPEAAHVYFERALRLSPLDPMNFNNHVGIASAFQVAGQPAKAADEFLRALHERPNALWIHRNLAPALLAAGREEEAKASRDALAAAYPDFTIARFKEAMVFDPDTLERIANDLRKLGVPEV